MASNNTSSSSKIPRPRYVKSKIPVMTCEYKATLKKVKQKHIEIEQKEAEVIALMKEKSSIVESMSKVSLDGEPKRDTCVSGPKYSTSEIRSIIRTPGGTKRKGKFLLNPYTESHTSLLSYLLNVTVRPSHVNFQKTLSEFLEENVKSSSQNLDVEELLKRLEICEATHAMPKTQLLNEVSKALKKSVCYRGKKKEAYYKGLELVCVDQFKSRVDNQVSVSNQGIGTSPASKIPRAKLGSINKSALSPSCESFKESNKQDNVSDCRTRLTFEDSSSNLHEDMQKLESTSRLSKATESSTSLCTDKQAESTSTLPKQTHSSTSVYEGLGLASMKEQDLVREQFRVFYNMMLKVHTMATTELEDDLEECQSSNRNLLGIVASMEKSLQDYIRVTSEIISNQKDVIDMYKDITQTGKLFGGLLSLSETKAIKEEISKAKQIFNLGIRSKELVDMRKIINPGIFNRLLENLKAECPTITNILEVLILSPNASRNTKKTPLFKLKAGLHLLASIMDVRDQNGKNDIPLLFGLLCLCYGAGPQMIELMQHLGLSESHHVLCNVLMKQLLHYKELINQRCSADSPIVTYQDNMQLMRTSMRHLRLSKLQKEKIKQGKMWDFTVRGWRLADTCGIEDLFKEPSTATEPQKDVATLEYKDTKIESNPVHLKKFEDFKDRDLLRKLDIALNKVTINGGELKDADIGQLKQISNCESHKGTKPKYIIKIPEVPIEFPHLAEVPSKIYPLPISQENQCKTLGMGRNLDLFTEEFGFDIEKKKKFLPLKKSKREFDLELGYTRFSFLKAMDRHKEQQQVLESTLRGNGLLDNENTEQLVLVDADLSESDSDNET